MFSMALDSGSSSLRAWRTAGVPSGFFVDQVDDAMADRHGLLG